MTCIDTALPGLKVVEPKIWHDPRGYFFESYQEKNWNECGIKSRFVQDNEAFSSKGVLRGLHYQLPPFGQAKLVRVVQGEVLDVVVDIRSGSETFGQHFSILLSSENKRQLFIPQGFAHGYIVTSETALFQYKCDQYYAQAFEAGIIYNDPVLAIDWKLDPEEYIVSNKDINLPTFGNHKIWGTT
jgi:dTDP-4-dehydrorhamnose 3,5-epimerase